jgi:hypothetical protein
MDQRIDKRDFSFVASATPLELGQTVTGCVGRRFYRLAVAAIDRDGPARS